MWWWCMILRSHYFVFFISICISIFIKTSIMFIYCIWFFEINLKENINIINVSVICIVFWLDFNLYFIAVWFITELCRKYIGISSISCFHVVNNIELMFSSKKKPTVHNMNKKVGFWLLSYFFRNLSLFWKMKLYR